MVIVQKVITCRLNISDVANQFCPDYKKMRMDELTKQYVGYCSHGIFITEIVQIIRSGQIHTNSKTLDGGMHLNIEALVKGILYERDEIIPDAVISKITDTTAVASSRYASIIINVGHSNILKVGDTTPVIVRMSQYNKLTDKIAIAANPFIPVHPIMHIYVLDGEYKEDAEITELFSRINDCKKKLGALSADAKKSVEHFNNLIYAYAVPKKWSSKINLQGMGGENKELQLTDMHIDNLYKEFKEDSVQVFLPSTKYLDNNVYLIKNNTGLGGVIWKMDGNVVLVTQVNKQDGYKSILSAYYKQLYTLLQMSETYPTKTELSKSSHIWKFYEMNRIK